MTTIAKHTGQNIGGIASVEFALPAEISSITVFPGFKILVSFIAPADWKPLYATAMTFSGNGSCEVTPAGTLHQYDFKFRCPKDRQDLIDAFFLIHHTGAILRVKDANSMVRIYGTPSNPLTMKSKLLLPGEVQGYNGYEIVLSVSSPDPAYTEMVL